MVKFVEAYKKRFNKDPSFTAFAGYEAFNIAVFIYRKVKSNRTAPMQRFLARGNRLPSLTGPIRMGALRTPIKSATIMKTTAEGARYVTKIAM